MSANSFKFQLIQNKHKICKVSDLFVLNLFCLFFFLFLLNSLCMLMLILLAFNVCNIFSTCHNKIEKINAYVRVCMSKHIAKKIWENKAKEMKWYWNNKLEWNSAQLTHFRISFHLFFVVIILIHIFYSLNVHAQ